MSLIGFFNFPEVNARLKPLRPKTPRTLKVPLRVQPQGKAPQLLGTAFDYLLRFELQRRAPHAVARGWVADGVPGVIRWAGPDGSVATRDFFPDVGDASYLPPDEVLRRVNKVLADAHADVAAYLGLASPTPADGARVAGHALRLARLDPVVRALRLGRDFEDAPVGDIQELLALLDIVPFAEFTGREPLLLNPTFGASGRLVGGTDADVVAGDLLVDVKTLGSAEVTAKTLDQLLHYVLVARRERLADPAGFPEIRRAGIYLSRHAHLWALDVSVWTKHSEFAALEEWYFQKAAEMFGETAEG